MQINNDYRLDHASADALGSILRSFADYGSSINMCRTFCKVPSKTPTIQSFSAALSAQLNSLNTKLANLQSQYANLNTHTTSLIVLQNTLQPDLEVFHSLKPLVSGPHTSTSLLTELHELACHSNAIGDVPFYKFVLRLFIPTLETYLRPLHAWMTSGQLQFSNDFFINHSQEGGIQMYDLTRDANNGVAAPRFMLPVINRILAAGKTMAFVNRMSVANSSIPSSDTFPQFETNGVNPFEQAFEMTLDAWITEKYALASESLKVAIHDTSEIWRELDRVHGIYSMLSHQNMTLFMDKLFQKVYGL